jgi:ATP-grasp ribosomal peptide maturase
MRVRSAEPPVLVVTRLDDATADVVIGELNRREVPVVRLDPGDFPYDVSLGARLDGAGLHGSAGTPTRAVDLAGVRSVYWRRPRPYAGPTGLEEQSAHWCADQARYGLGGVLATLPGAHYVNHPWRNRDAEYKPAQLAQAARCGLDVPDTLVTNEPGEAQEFAAAQGRVVYKPLWNSDFRSPGGHGLTVWVDEVTAPGDGVRHTAHLFQRYIRKAADVRVTAVGDEVFAIRIDGSPGPDWRRHYDALSYTAVEVPAGVVEGVHGYLDAFGLVFGAFDFGLDSDGRWWFFECNPNGQWAWFPDVVSTPIATALADQLEYGRKGGAA